MDPSRNIKLIIEYDGTEYAGWQRQENAVTVQEKIEVALSQILQKKTTIVGAGRTDSGVHARGQVANFHTDTSLDPYFLKGGLNGLLPHDIVVHSVDEVPIDFHARHSARGREYSYTISRKKTALMRQYSWQLAYDLDIALMKKIAQSIVGAHDFQSFCRAQTDVEHYRCQVKLAEWKEVDALLVFTIQADRFLHGMVRTLVGTMIDVGRKYIPEEEFSRILDKKVRTAAGFAAPAKGLILERVFY